MDFLPRYRHLLPQHTLIFYRTGVRYSLLGVRYSLLYVQGWFPATAKPIIVHFTRRPSWVIFGLLRVIMCRSEKHFVNSESQCGYSSVIGAFECGEGKSLCVAPPTLENYGVVPGITARGKESFPHDTFIIRKRTESFFSRWDQDAGPVLLSGNERYPIPAEILDAECLP